MKKILTMSALSLVVVLSTGCGKSNSADNGNGTLRDTKETGLKAPNVSISYIYTPFNYDTSGKYTDSEILDVKEVSDKFFSFYNGYHSTLVDAANYNDYL